MMVSVYCMAYNHGKFIREALESFVMQKTNFDFEVIVHDDCSTDNTADIIREFAERYPDIIKPIYQTENQYSKGVKIVDTYIYPRITGRYIAVCEGDDCWIDENKLQKQVDFLEAHPEFVGVYANVKIVNENEEEETLAHFPHKSAHEVEFREYQENQYRAIGHISSMMYKRSVIDISPERLEKLKMYKGNGDVLRSFELLVAGRVYYMEEVFSKYRHITDQGDSWSARARKKNIFELLYIGRKTLFDFAEDAFSLPLRNDPISKNLLFKYIMDSYKWEKGHNKKDIQTTKRLAKDFIATYGIIDYLKRIFGRLCRDMARRLKKLFASG